MKRQSTDSPRKKPTQRRAQETVTAILQATVQIIVESGFEGISTNRVAKRAGVSVGSLYQYFPNKESLVLAVWDQHNNKMIELIGSIAVEMATAPIADAVRVYMTTMTHWHTSDPKLHRVLGVQAIASGMPHFKKLNAQARMVVRGYLELRKDQIIPTDLDTAAFVLVGAADSLMQARLMLEPEDVTAEALQEETIALICRYLLGDST